MSLQIDRKPSLKMWQLILIMILFGIGFLLILDKAVAAAAGILEGKQPFDHGLCQYPERLSNPVDGCDNSDPARPECVTKFGTEDCDLPYPTLPAEPGKTNSCTENT